MDEQQGKNAMRHLRKIKWLKWLNPFRLKLIACFLLLIILATTVMGMLIAMTDNNGGAGCDTGALEMQKELNESNDKTPLDQLEDAKLIFSTLVNAHGFGGAGAAGVVAVVERESHFNHLAVNPGGGVAGWFQWSGWGHNVNGSRITSEGSIKAGDISTLTKENQFKLLAYELNGTFNGVKKNVGNESDPYQAALTWSRDFEGVSLSDGQTKAEMLKEGAARFYKELGGEGIKPNPSLLGAKEGANSGSASESADNNISCSLSGSGADGYGLPVKGQFSLGTGTYPSYTTGSTAHDHNGIDFRNQGLNEGNVSLVGNGAEVYAVHNGKVESVMQRGDEYIVILSHTDGKYSYYGHSMRKPPENIKPGASVARGQHITYQGYGGDVRPKNLGAAHVHVGFSTTGNPNGFMPNSKEIISPAGLLPLPTEVLPDGVNMAPDTRVTGSGFSKYFDSLTTDKSLK